MVAKYSSRSTREEQSRYQRERGSSFSKIPCFLHSHLTLEMKVSDATSDWIPHGFRFRSSPPYGGGREEANDGRNKDDTQVMHLFAFSPQVQRSVSCQVVFPFVVREQRFNKGNPYSCHLFVIRQESHFLSQHRLILLLNGVFRKETNKDQ